MIQLHGKRLKAAVAAVTIAGATGAAMLVPAAPAVAFSSGGLVLDLVIESPAHLIARGAAIGLPVEYTCSGTNNANLQVNVTERVSGGQIADGSGSLGPQQLVCTGEIQNTVLEIQAVGTRAFNRGTAFAAGSISGCNDTFTTCGQQPNSRTFTIQS